MFKRIFSGITLAMLFISMLTLTFNIQPVKASGTIYIRADGSIDPPTAPILNVANTIYTFTDNITDNIVVERSSIVIDGNGYVLQGSQSGYGISLSDVSNITLKWTCIKNFNKGIYLNGSDLIHIFENNITDNYYGIGLKNSINNIIQGNNITANQYHSIGLDHSPYNTIVENQIIIGEKGISLTASSSNNIYRNNLRSIHTSDYGIYVHVSKNNNLSENNIENSRTGIYLYVSSSSLTKNNVLNSGDYGIYATGNNYTISANNITDTGRVGMCLWESSDSIIFNNNIANSGSQGVWFTHSPNNVFFGNNVIGNSHGIMISGSSNNNTVSENNIAINLGYGLLIASSGNEIYHNNFIDNTHQASSGVGYPNVWDHGYPSGGNYWSDYTDVDLYSGPYQNETGSDGIGDAALSIDSSNTDHYPLMNPHHLTLPWADDDEDGILNYLEHFDTPPEYGIDTLMAVDGILGVDWHAKISKIRRQSISVSYSYVMDELYRWGVKKTDMTSRVWPIIIDLENVILWLESMQDKVPFLNSLVDWARDISCSDGHVRYLLLLHSDLTLPHVADLLIKFSKAYMSSGVKSAEKWFDIFVDIATHIDFDIYRLKGLFYVSTEPIFDLADTLGEFTDFVDSMKLLKDFALVSILLAFEVMGIGTTGGASLAIRTAMFFLEYAALDWLNIGWIKNILNAIDPPDEKMVLQLHDSTTGELLLGYNATSSEDISDFPNGIYLSQNDSALMILSRSSLDYNLTVYSATSTSIIPYALSTRDCMTNQTITTGGFLPPNQTATTTLRIENDTLKISYLTITANFSNTNPKIGESVIANISVTDNLGEYVENAGVSAIIGNQFIPAQNLGSGRHQLTLNTTTMQGFYDVTLFTTETPNGYLQGMSIYPLVVGIVDVAITNLTCSKTVIGKSCSAPIGVTIENQANYTETSLTLYANKTIILEQEVSLPSQGSLTITLAWNTTLYAKGQYRLKAYVGPILGEIDITDNTFIDGTLQIVGVGNWATSFTGLGGHPIVDFAVYNGNLYAAADNTLYLYNGSNWTTIDAPTFVVSLEPYEEKLFVGGRGELYSFDGTAFNLIFSVPTYIKVLGVYNNTLYAGTVLDKPPTLYYCNGSAENPDNWHVDTAFSTTLNFSGPFSSIDSFAVYNNIIYVTSGGTVYSYNGTEWSIAKTYVDVTAFLDMKVYNGKLYLATRDQGWRKPIYLGHSGFSGRIIEFDGVNWTTILDHDYWIYSLGIYDGKLYAGTANKIYTYNGTDWEISFHSEEGAYYAISLTTYDGKIYAGMGNGYIFADPAETASPQTPTVPEFPSFIILLLFMIATLLAVIVYSRKKVSDRAG